MASDRIFLIDGMSQVFRAYYAIGDLSTGKGVPTNAVYGFITMLRKLLAEEQPAYLAVAFDPAGPTVRHLQYEEYKAHRRPTPPELVAQIPLVHRFCRAMRIPVLIEPQHEADDVIGTLSAVAEKAGLHTVIVTLDKDMLQLVSDRTQVLDTRHESVLYDRQKVLEKMGVAPEQIADLLGLWGDSSDNIPGAPGIGEKGAVDLIGRFGSVDECLARWAEVERKSYRESLRDHVEIIRQSRDLATIRRDLPIRFDLEELRLGPPDYEALSELYRELEFTSLLKTLPVDVRKEESATIEVQRVASAADLFQAEASGSSEEVQVLAFAALGMEPVAELAVCTGPGKVRVISGEAGSRQMKEAWENLAAAGQTRCTHDLKTALLQRGFGSPGGDLQADDLMIMAYLVNPLKGDYSLPVLIEEWLPEIPAPALVTRGQEAHWIRMLLPQLSGGMERLGLRRLYETIELPLVHILADMEAVGVRVDCGLLASLSAEMEAEIQKLRLKAYEIAGTEFNLDSPKQLGEVLFDKLNLPVLKRTRKTKGYSTDQEVLEELAASYDLPRAMLDYRQLTKLKSTYVEALPRLVRPETSRVHTSYNQTVAATGRLSSSNPNLQNIPIRTDLGRRIRAAFVAAPGNRLVAADYSQIELRVMAHLSEDAAMVDAFLNNQDIHERTASEVFGMAARMNPSEYRRRAKVINFGILYGLSAFGLAKQLQISRPEAQRFIDSYFERYRGVRQWLDETLRQALDTGSVRTLFGRVRPIPELKSRDKNTRSFGERIATNTPIQGTAADLIKLAMVQLHAELNRKAMRTRLILQVHDELVLECPENEVDSVKTLVRDVMEGIYTLKVPLRADVNSGMNWKDLK